MKKIVYFLFSLSCSGQEINKEFYAPMELEYIQKSMMFKLNGISVLDYVKTNPLVARQVYDTNLKEFKDANSKLKFTKDECENLVVNYVNNKTSLKNPSLFYNLNSNKKQFFDKISENTYFSGEEKDTNYYKCICINYKLLRLQEDFNELQSEFNLPGGHEVSQNEFRINSIFLELESLNTINFSEFDIFRLNKKFKTIKKSKSIIFSSINSPTKMYLLKNDPVEIIEAKDNWLKIKYYPEKNGEWTGKTIEGWIKKSDVE